MMLISVFIANIGPRLKYISYRFKCSNPWWNNINSLCLLCNCFPDGGLSHEPDSSPTLPDFGGVPQQSPLVVQSHQPPQASPSPPAILHDLQQPDSTSYVLLNLAKGGTAANFALFTALLIRLLKKFFSICVCDRSVLLMSLIVSQLHF